MNSVTQMSAKTQLIILLLAYIIFSSIFGYSYRYAINPDGISHLRLAGYIAEGNFHQSVTSSWSPLLSWLMSPLIYFGFEGLFAARIVIALSGLGLLCGAWFFSLRFDLSHNGRFLVLLTAALLISYWTILNIGADIVIAAFLLFYFYMVTNPDILQQKKIPFRIGVFMGIAYLAKNYAFPFFVLHFPVTLLTRYFIDREGECNLKKKLLVSWVVGMAGFLIISSIWISVLSAKYDKFTITDKGKIAYSLMGPEEVRHLPMFKDGLHKPVNPYAIHIFEDHSVIQWESWSPFESKEYFMHQLKLIKNNIAYIYDHFLNNSPFFTKAFIVGLLVIIPIAFLLNPMNERKKFLYVWSALTFVIYSSGYVLLIARSPRRFYAVMCIFLLLAFHFIEEMIAGLNSMVSGRRKKILTLFLIVIFLSAFTIKPGFHFIRSLKNVINDDQVNAYREIAEQVSKIEFPVPYGIVRSAQKAYTDYYIAYYIKKQFVGRPISLDIKGITEELEAADAKSLLVFDSLEIVERLKEDDRYTHTAGINLKNDKRYFNAVNSKMDVITDWDRTVNVFIYHLTERQM